MKLLWFVNPPVRNTPLPEICAKFVMGWALLSYVPPTRLIRPLLAESPSKTVIWLPASGWIKPAELFCTEPESTSVLLIAAIVPVLFTGPESVSPPPFDRIPPVLYTGLATIPVP